MAKTKVIFKIEEVESPAGNSWEDRVLAIFPRSESSRNGYVTTYSHSGQHSEASIPYIASLGNASPEEYIGLKRELDGLGYDLEVADEEK